MDNGFPFCRWRESKKKTWSRICGRGNLFFHHGTQFFQLSEWHEEEFAREWKRKELKPDKLAMLFVFNSLYTFWAVLFFTSLSSLLTSPLFSLRSCLNWCAGIGGLRRCKSFMPCKWEKSLKFSANFHIFHLPTINYHVNLMKFFISHLRSFHFLSEVRRQTIKEVAAFKKISPSHQKTRANVDRSELHFEVVFGCKGPIHSLHLWP